MTYAPQEAESPSPKGRRIVLIVGAVAIATWAVVAGMLLARPSDSAATSRPPAAVSPPRAKPKGLPLAFLGADRVRVPPPSDSDELRLHALAKAASTYATKHDAFLVAESGLVPDAPCCERPLRLCEPNAARWSGDPWLSLAFNLDQSTPFQYGYSGTKERFTVVATGDTNCDGRAITYIAEGSFDQAGGRKLEYFTLGAD